MIAAFPDNADRSAQARKRRRTLARAGWIVDMIRQCREVAESLRGCPDSTLQQHTRRLRSFALTGEHADGGRLLSLALGGVLEAIRQRLQIRLFDVQLHAGLIVAGGGVAEMQTGEGKTLALALPAYYHALFGKGVHVATPNAYLAARDRELLTPVFAKLGISTGLLTAEAKDRQARVAYQADITYGPGYCFGFDYLRDQLAQRHDGPATLGGRFAKLVAADSSCIIARQRGLHVAIIDEIDHVLLDDAVSPLVLTHAAEGEAADAELHRRARTSAIGLHRDRDYRIDDRRLELTESGFDEIYAASDCVVDPQLRRPWHEYVVLALRAEHLFQREVDYVVRDRSIKIVEAATGRIHEDRSWSDGLHQAMEAKEAVPISCERAPQARITRQAFYRGYTALGGMTGTASGCEREFAATYGLPVLVVPPRKPSRRRSLPTQLLLDQPSKLASIGEECEAMVRAGRAVLVGTTTIAESRRVAEQLQQRGLAFELLNGVQDADEAEVISRAGQRGAITVATNLAGRGTDIPLDASVRDAGGLHVIVFAPGPLERAQRQLIGRCARCGDPGTTRLYLSAQDAIASRDAPWIGRAIRRWFKSGQRSALDVAAHVKRVQHRNARHAAWQRWQMLRSDRQDEQLMAASNAPRRCCAL